MRRKQIKLLNGAVFISCIVILGLYSSRAITIPDANIPLLARGAVFRRMETLYQDSFPLKGVATGFWAALNFQLFHEGRNGVIVGKDNWLFSSEEYSFPANFQEIWDKNLQRIIRQVQLLRKNDIQVLVALVPEKVDLYRNMLTKDSEHNSINLYNRSYAYLTGRGLRVVNLRNALAAAVHRGQQVFFRTDTHWTVHGSRLAARAIADDNSLPYGEEKFVTGKKETKTLSGDLMNFIPTGSFFAQFGPPPDTMSTVTIRKEEEDDVELFTDTVLNTALVGTSYSADKRWQFVDWLQLFLHKELINYADTGTGPFAPMKTFINENLRNEQQISFVIWEIPVRYLLVPPDHNTTGKEIK